MKTTQIIEKICHEISFYKSQINDNLKYVSQYDRFVKDNEKFLEENPDKEEEFFKEAYYNFHSYFPYLINNSLLVAFDSYVEYKLQLIFSKFCTEKEKKNNKSYIEYYVQNISLNYQIDLSVFEDDWIKIKKLHSIRNRIVHGNSSISKSFQPSINEIVDATNSRTYKYLMEFNEHINYNEFTTRFYIIDYEFLLQFLNSIENVLLNILRHIDEN